MPLPAERQELELPRGPEEPLLPQPHRQVGRLLLILLLFIGLLLIVLFR